MDYESETTSRPSNGKRFSDGSLGNTRGHLRLNGRARKDVRREEAFARVAAWQSLPLKERLSRLPEGGAVRQRARYTRMLVDSNVKASQTSQLVKDAKGMVERGEAVSLSEAKRKLSLTKT